MRSEATLKDVIRGNLLVGRTKTLSFRQDRLPLSGIAEAAGETERAREEENTTGLLFVFTCKASTVNPFLNKGNVL